MKRQVATSVGAALVLLAIAVAVAVVMPRVSSSEPVYTVAQVQAGLAHDPRAWVGRSVWVRGTVVADVYAPSLAAQEVIPGSYTLSSPFIISASSCGPSHTPCQLPVPHAPGGLVHWFLVADEAAGAVTSNPHIDPIVSIVSSHDPHAAALSRIVPALVLRWQIPKSSPPDNPVLATLRSLPGFASVLPGVAPPRILGGVSRMYHLRILPMRDRHNPHPNLRDDAVVLGVRP